MMQSIDLNLASRPFRNNTLLWAGYGGALVALIAFGVWNVMTWRGSVKAIGEITVEVSSIENVMQDYDQRELKAEAGIAEFDLKALEIQASKANEVIEWKAFSWTRLFNLMEKVLPYDVRMTSIRPLFQGGRRRGELEAASSGQARAVPVSVEGMAKDFRAVWELQNALLADAHFGRVYPERLQRTDRGEIVFNITFLYEPDVVVDDLGAIEAVELPGEAPGETEVEAEEAPIEPEAGADAAAPAENRGAEATAAQAGPAGAQQPIVEAEAEPAPEKPQPVSAAAKRPADQSGDGARPTHKPRGSTSRPFMRTRQDENATKKRDRE
jgi:hypothetical protein